MLSVLKDGERLRTSIMNEAETSWTVYSKRLALLIEHGLIEELDGMDRPVALTDKGRKFISYYENLNEIFPKET